MKRKFDYEQVKASLNGEIVTFRCEDGTKADVPRSVVANSTLLNAAISDASPGDEVDLCLPTGMLQKWLQCVDDLEEPYVVQLLKVADFMGDDKSVKSLCTQVSSWLFGASPGCWRSWTERGKVVAELPSHLTISVLKHCPLTTAQLLSSAPECLAVPVVHALFPEIMSDGTVMLDDEDYSTVYKTDAHFLWPILCQIPELVDLDLQGYYLGEEIFPLLKNLSSFTSLRRLSLSGNEMPTGSVVSLMSALSKLSFLQDLEVGDNDWDEAGFARFAEGFSSLGSLTRLSLGSHILNTATRCFTSLNKDIMQRVASRLQDLTALKCLNMNDSRIYVRSASELGSSLTTLSTLQRLHLGGNPLGPPGVRAVAKCLGSLPSLQILDLSDTLANDFLGFNYDAPESRDTTDAVRYLGACLADCKGLLGLKLGDNCLHDEDMISLMFHLKRVTSLQELNLENNEISLEAMKALMPWFESLTNLQRLLLSHDRWRDRWRDSKLTADDEDAVRQLAQKLPSLCTFFVSQTNICEFNSSGPWVNFWERSSNW